MNRKAVDFYKITHLPEFEASVRNYFNEKIYSGFTEHFEFDSFEIHQNNKNVLYVIPKGIDEDIIDADAIWEEGLRNIGRKHKIDLILHPTAYSK